MFNEEIDTGSTGAKRQTWENGSARALLLQIVEANPTADEATITRMFRDQCEPHLDELAAYWVANNYRALRPRPSSPRSVNRTVVAEKTKSRMTQLVLLDLVLPNGKMLRDCTFAEVGQAGGWLTRLSKCGQPGEIIGATMSEQEVRKVYEKL